ncbi:hypothetical protein BE221DRAFT_147975 [Ostreococcus tauri]|uniref:LysM domain-containing protein n=1 Tax=Ostreococcus tauri TaxID=70448 RepID=A0A1Y5I4H8_OSTTA|nr:hypothetical protein BE221DRAFT_147975 [Ostreococcus tauri]
MVRGKTAGTGTCRLDAARRTGRAEADALIPGRWCALVNGEGVEVGRVCVRDAETETETKTEGGRGLQTRVVGGAKVAVGWLKGVVSRARVDEDARAARKEARRLEREAAMEETRARKEKERIEREEAKAALAARETQLELLRAEEKRLWELEREEEKKRKEEARAAEKQRKEEARAAEKQRKEEARAASGRNATEETAASPGQSPFRHVEEIKHAVSEGAHHLGEVAQSFGSAVKEQGDRVLHGVSEQAHYYGDFIREKNDKVVKSLAKRRWVRGIASRVSPNALLVAAICVFLAGLPENRLRARDKVRSIVKKNNKKVNDVVEAENETEDEWPADFVYNAGDEDEDTAYIGRGPTPRGVYEVMEGDTLCSIAGCFNLDVVEIIDRNGDVIKNPENLSPGERIRIY